MERKKRRNRLISFGILASLILLTAIQVLIQQLRLPTPIAGNILIFALFNVNLILLLILILLVFRSLFKIYIERKNRVIGSRFRTRLVAAFVVLSLLPAIVLFLVASNFITISVESWFNVQVEDSIRKSMEIARGYFQVTEGRALSLTEEIARRIEQENLLEGRDYPQLRQLIREKQEEYHLGLLAVYNPQGRQVVVARDPKVGRFSTLKWVRQGLKGEEVSQSHQLQGKDLIRAVVPIHSGKDPKKVIGAVISAQLLPFGLSRTVNEISTAFKEYNQLKMLQNPIKSLYLMVFLMITLLVMFAAIWAAIHMARRITVPIQLLAEGTREVAAGNLGYQVEVSADDEVGMLVDSFNQMTRDLLRSKEELETAYLDLRKSNIELDQRRIYMEAVLENVTAGVLSLDEEGHINTINRAALSMLNLEPEQALHKSHEEVFSHPDLKPIGTLIRRMVAEGIESSGQQVNLHVNGKWSTLVVSIAGLHDEEKRYQGMVVVFDDLTELLKAQQAMAWREVARSIAHEIKNPLTPIQLSTQRLRKKFLERSPDYEGVIVECTDTIIQEVEGLKELVSEFSRYARMPSSELKPDDLNQVVERVLQLYAGLAKRSVIRKALDPNLPLVNLDAAQMRRALINMVDNAIAAIKKGGVIEVSTRYLAEASLVRLEVADTGPGIAPEDKERLFLPYFSKTKGGTGLGLAIVHRIVGEHSGRIRVEDNRPRGTRMIVELPALPEESFAKRSKGDGNE
ncbi:MAG: ATP-binding protein [candidate division NC10 bacterium]|nr:ATP-binding protein [candidate division NC10 bacterium]